MDRLARVTPATLHVLDALLSAHPGPCSGYTVKQQAGHPSGTVYVILRRLEAAGWLTGEWETGPPAGVPLRRLYTFTPEGEAAARALTAARRSGF